MKTHNEKLLRRSKEFSDGNVKKSWETARKLTRPSKAARVGATVGLSIGSGLLLGGLVGVAFGQFALGAGSVTAGAVTVVTNAVNLSKKKSGF